MGIIYIEEVYKRKGRSMKGQKRPSNAEFIPFEDFLPVIVETLAYELRIAHSDALVADELSEFFEKYYDIVEHLESMASNPNNADWLPENLKRSISELAQMYARFATSFYSIAY